MDKLDTIKHLKLLGWSFADIGDHLNISRQRAHQILGGGFPAAEPTREIILTVEDGRVRCAAALDLKHIQGKDLEQALPEIAHVMGDSPFAVEFIHA